MFVVPYLDTASNVAPELWTVKQSEGVFGSSIWTRSPNKSTEYLVICAIAMGKSHVLFP